MLAKNETATQTLRLLYEQKEYSEGAEMYSMSLSKFQQLAKDAKACYKMNRLVLVNLDILDEYLETFHIEDEEFYK